MKKSKSLLLLLLTLTLILSQVSMVSAAEPINEIRNLIQQYYVEEVPASILEKPTIQEITGELDPYSVYMTKQEFDRFTSTINQELVGIGVVLEEHEQGVKLIQILPNSPADKASLQAGDIITNANGKSLEGESVQTAVTYISGAENTSVTITVFQPATGQTSTKTIQREKISLPNVEAKMLGGNIGYIRLYSFSMNAAKEIQTAIASLKGAKGFIFDLRDNGGGYVSAAQEISGLFPNVKHAFQLRERSNTQEVYKAIKQTTPFTAQVHILINENSASASEMVSASIKEQEGAILYGQTSYGKGSMQSMFILDDGSVFKLTTANFFSPKGTVINGVGVTPNVETEIGEELAASHRDHLINNYSPYKKLPALHNVPTTKTFTVKLNVNMNWDTISPKDVELIQLGGDEVETQLKIIDKKTIQVTPTKPLVSKEKYMLVIHPNWKTIGNKTMKSGVYLEIDVE